MHPQKVNKLGGTDCGVKATILPQISPEVSRSIESGNASIDTLTDFDKG
jgi:hypothetical protein